VYYYRVWLEDWVFDQNETEYIDIDNENVEVYCLDRLGVNVLFLGGDPVITLDYQRQGQNNGKIVYTIKYLRFKYCIYNC